MNTNPVVLREAELMSTYEIRDLCAELKMLAHAAMRGDSTSVDRPEWKAARLIEALMRQRA